jgi:hypothetical protein
VYFLEIKDTLGAFFDLLGDPVAVTGFLGDGFKY